MDTSLLQALPIPVYTTDAAGYLTFYNEAAVEFWGQRPALGTTRWSGALKLFTLDGEPLAHERCQLGLLLTEGQAADHPAATIAIVERPDGSRVSYRAQPSLLRDAQGQVSGAINVLVDVGDRLQADIELARLAAIVSSSDDAIVSKNLNGRINSWNAAATRMFGYEPDEIVGRSILTIIPPELRDEEAEIVARIKRGERVEHFDTVRLTKSGKRIEVSLSISPLLSRSGVVVGASKIARDITERKRAEQLQRLLFDELNHRVKNTLATIQAIAGQSLRGAADPVAFVASFNGRIQSLGRAHDVLVAGQMKGADIAKVIAEQVMLGSASNARIATQGPTVFLNAKAAVNLGLVLHELATNARKYGALAPQHDAGRLAIGWKVFSYPRRELIITWRESGIAGLRPANARGFGTTLIERTLETVGGRGALRYQDDGIACELVVPLPLDPTAAHDAPLGVMGDGEPLLEPPSPDVLRGKRVLVVEDEVLVALDIESILGEAGMIVVGQAGTLAKAQQMIEETACDAVLLDANLGGAPVDSLAAMLDARGVPFAFATGYGRAGVPQAFSAAPVLTKPFVPEQLVKLMRQVLKR